LAISSENNYETIIENTAEHLAKFIDVDRLLTLCESFENTEKDTILVEKKEANVKFESKQDSIDFKIAVAQDDAFNFTYFENIKALENLGTVVYFSPLKDKVMPKADILYLAGCYPELHLEQLTANISMRKSILDFCFNGGKVISEFEGMMYLGNQITNADGIGYQMAGFLPIETSMEKVKLSLGYREVQLDSKIIKGHEFHYSTAVENENLSTIGKVFNAKGIELQTSIYKLRNVMASYIHFYWGECNFIDDFLLDGIDSVRMFNQ
jgi:cobyrinic acid a,c-diamide synthase